MQIGITAVRVSASTRFKTRRIDIRSSPNGLIGTAVQEGPRVGPKIVVASKSDVAGWLEVLKVFDSGLGSGQVG